MAVPITHKTPPFHTAGPNCWHLRYTNTFYDALSSKETKSKQQILMAERKEHMPENTCSPETGRYRNYLVLTVQTAG